MLTPVTSASYQNVQLNAGIICIGLDMSTYTTVSSAKTAISALIGTSNCLGATLGGGTFSAKPTQRKIQLDGVRYGWVGDTVTDEWDISLKGTMKELTADNIKRALASADSTTSGSVTTISIRTDINSTDYINKLVWVGDTAYGLMAICLDNALNANGMELNFKDKGEGEIGFEFHAHQSGANSSDNAPCAIYLLKN